jgi:hypothetical protein
MAHVDQVDEPWAKEIILLRRARAVLHWEPDIAGFWAKSYETLHIKSTETSRLHRKIKCFDVAQAELIRSRLHLLWLAQILPQQYI